MSQPNLVHLAQLAAAAPLSACASEASESTAPRLSGEAAEMPAPLPAALVAIPGALLDLLRQCRAHDVSWTCLHERGQ